MEARRERGAHNVIPYAGLKPPPSARSRADRNTGQRTRVSTMKLVCEQEGYLRSPSRSQSSQRRPCRPACGTRALPCPRQPISTALLTRWWLQQQYTEAECAVPREAAGREAANPLCRRVDRRRYKRRAGDPVAYRPHGTNPAT
jgi:hypothetical protein